MVYGMNRAVQNAWIEAYPAFFRSIASAVGWRREAAHARLETAQQPNDKDNEDEDAEDEVEVSLDAVRNTPQPVGADEVEVSLERDPRGSTA